MDKQVLIIDNSQELRVIEGQMPELKEAPLILLSNNFNPRRLNEFKARGFHYFDEQIDDTDTSAMIRAVHRILWSWFRDEDGNDLSLVNGCSLGMTFASSLEMLLNTILRYYAGLKKMLSAESEVYFTSNAEDIYLSVINLLQREIGFKVHVIDTDKRREVYLYGKKKLKLDSASRKRDLSPLFIKSGLKDIAIDMLLKLWQRAKNDQSGVLVVTAGKMETYFDQAVKSGSRINYILPFERKYVFGSRSPRIKFYHFYSKTKAADKGIGKIIKALKYNIQKRIKDVNPQVLISVMNAHIFSFFPGALAYYNGVLEQLCRLKPKLVLLSTDTYENHILIAQAAKKCGIRTALIPHGLYGWGYPEYKNGPNQLFDRYLAFGRKDLSDYKAQGVKEDAIAISSFPYFARFMPAAKKRSGPYSKALILPLDFNNVDPGEKLSFTWDFIHSVIRLLSELGIEPVAIKMKESYSFRHMDITPDFLESNGREIPLLSGYDSFPQAAEGVDIVIGPHVTTAVIEAALMGIDYYSFSPLQTPRGIPSIPEALYPILNIAHSMDELKRNIIDKRPYNDGYSVYDLIDMDAVKTKEDLYTKFEDTLSDIHH